MSQTNTPAQTNTNQEQVLIPVRTVSRTLMPAQEFAPEPDAIDQEPLLTPSTLFRQKGWVSNSDLDLEIDPNVLKLLDPKVLESEGIDLKTLQNAPPTIPIDKSKDKKSEIIDLNYPFDIAKITPHNYKVQDAFSCVLKPCYDISLFSSPTYHLNRVSHQIQKDYPGYQHQIYSYRTVKKTQGTEIKRLKLIYKFDHKKQFVHVNVELLGEAKQ